MSITKSESREITVSFVDTIKIIIMKNWKKEIKKTLLINVN